MENENNQFYDHLPEDLKELVLIDSVQEGQDRGIIDLLVTHIKGQQEDVDELNAYIDDYVIPTCSLTLERIKLNDTEVENNLQYIVNDEHWNGEITLSEKDGEIFLGSLENSTEPNEVVKEAVEKYNTEVENE